MNQAVIAGNTTWLDVVIKALIKRAMCAYAEQKKTTLKNGIVLLRARK